MVINNLKPLKTKLLRILKPESLTDAQVERQDEVDNACHRLLNELAAASQVAHHGNDLVEWDIEHISAIREAVQEVLVDKLHLMTELEFYPYIEELPSIIPDDIALEVAAEYDPK
jgi:hypothetical protein